MEISAIKQNLSLKQVLDYYGLKPKNHMLPCPWHKAGQEKTPSLQVNLEKNFYKCHACGKSGDQIQFIEDQENITKHQAINKAKSMILPNTPTRPKPSNPMESKPKLDPDFLGHIFSYFKNGVSNSKPAKDYLESRSLNYKAIEVGYNGGQFHHGSRRDEQLIQQCLKYGLLIDKGQMAKTGDKAYTTFGKWCICFALRNKENQITGLYFRSTLNNDNAKHFYLKNRSGLYPSYPNVNTKKLILTESIIDAASLLQVELMPDYTVVACYGTNGLTQEHINCLSGLPDLEEVIFAFDNDKAGKEAITKYANLLLEEMPGVKISVLEPINKDINETLQLHNEQIFIELLDKRQSILVERLDSPLKETENFSFSTEPPKSGGGSPLDFLKQNHLLENLNIEIGKSGIVGEQNSRLLLFLITLSYLNKNPLHALVQGSSGSGKTHIISRIADLMPPEDVLRFTRITESSLYNWGEYDLFGKVIVIEDLDGLKEDALYALREFISNQVLRSSVTIKDKKGNNKSAHKIVKGQFSSLSATTKGETYEDNMSRSFLIAVDESKEQTADIINYQNRRNAGEIDPHQSQKAIHFIQNIVRQLKPYEVVNPYATKLQLPEKVHKIRRLNEMYQAVIKQVTFLNQYQRKCSPLLGRGAEGEVLITEIEDIEQATEVLFESIVLKVDELDGSLRQFFERLKKYVKDETQDFTQREVRQEMNMSKTQMFRYIQSLTELEYIKQTGGYHNKGIKYKISHWDNYQKLRAEIKDYLMLQIEELKNKV